jgi:hypothetical protein
MAPPPNLPAIQYSEATLPAWTIALETCNAHPVGVLPHIKKLEDALGHFLVRITCKRDAQRIADPEALARLCGPSATFETVGKRMRCSMCGVRVPRYSRCQYRDRAAEAWQGSRLRRHDRQGFGRERLGQCSTVV